jgi:nucleoside-diphosphate-sugar epimerase
MRLAVTGASGFIGAAICRAAVGAGAQVHGFGRRAEVDLPGASYHRWDLAGTDPSPVAASAVDVVVHAAATVTDWTPPGRRGPSEVDQLRHVLAAFPDARLVHISTASVYDPYRPTVMAYEDLAPVNRYSTVYATQKAAAERSLADRPGTVVLRPRAVYGPGDRTVLPRLLAALRGGNLWLPGGGAVRQSLTSIDNLVSAVLLACASCVEGIFNVTDAAPITLADALNEVLAERGLAGGVRIRPVPVGVAVAAATMAELAYRLARSPTPPRLTRYAISQVAVERTLDITAARTRLGYRPSPTSFGGAATW